MGVTDLCMVKLLLLSLNVLFSAAAAMPWNKALHNLIVVTSVLHLRY